jgi:TolB-like protein/Tfp pilus assembly protein PilF
MIGRTIAHYKITAPLGAGGMGEVYRATDTKLGRDVALKVLPAEMARDAERLARFQREARAVAALNHPNIVTIFSVEESEGIHFLTMELVEGKSLDRLIPSGGLPADKIVEIAQALSGALAAAHDKGIIHRDLKPANVMVTDEGRVKVLDFGLAKETRAASHGDATLTSASNTKAGVVMGTPAYMSPEQISGRAVDQRTDIFSLGVLLYEMSTGRRPFEGQSSAELTSSILRDTPRPVTDSRTDLPSELGRIIQRCLEKDVAERFPSAQEVRYGLRGVTTTPAPVQTSAASTSRGVTQAGSGAARADEGFWVAVLPFKCRGANPELEALAEGLTEDIGTGLSRFSYLRVIARASTVKFSNESGDVRTIGRELGARYVMEGSLRQAGSKVRIAVQLVDAASGAGLWAETYDRPFTPEAALDLLDDVVPRIVATVGDAQGILPHSMTAALRNRDPESLTPYEAVLRSLGYHQLVNASEHLVSRTALEHAVKQAPDRADCWAMLSWLYRGEYTHGYNLLPDPLGRALASARRAIDLEPSSQLAHAALASALFFRRELSAFRPAAQRALSLNRMEGYVTAFLGLQIAFAGEWETGCALVERATQLNPNHPGWYWLPLAYNAYRQNEGRRALELALKVNMPGLWTAQLALAVIQSQVDELKPARAAVRDLLAIRPDFAAIARDELEKWWQPEMIEQLVADLRKAGLEIPEPGAAPMPPGAAGPATRIAQATSRVVPGSGEARADFGFGIAVLPFANLSADPDQEYFSDGLADDIINSLAQVSGLKVIARSSAFAFKGKQVDARIVAHTLGVSHLLEGSVRRSGTRIRVSAQLINALDGSQLRSERYDREMTDVFAIQNEIAEAIALQLKLRFTPSAASKTHRAPNLKAYEAYLRYRHHQWAFTPESIARARECLEQAIALDPDFALPYVGLADHHGASTFAGTPSEEALPRAREALRRALELDPDLAEAHGFSGAIAGLYDLDWKEAERQFRLAMATENVQWQVRSWYSIFFLLPLGRFEEARRESELVLQENPLSQICHWSLATTLQALGEYGKALSAFEKSVELDPQFWLGWTHLGLLHAVQGGYSAALHCAETSRALFALSPRNLGLMAGVLHNMGQQKQAEDLLTQWPSESVGSAVSRTCFHLVCGQFAEAISWAGRALDQRYFVAPNLARQFDKLLCQSPEWPAFVKKLRIPESMAALPAGREAAGVSASVLQPASQAVSGLGAARAAEGFWVAVLPFRVHGADAELEAMADGLTEDITSGLSRFPYLQVIAHNSAMAFKGRTGDMRAMARELGARYVMEGSVRKRGRALRVSAQLVDAASGTQLWSEAYDREISGAGAFQIQDDLTDRIVTTVADGYGVLVRSLAAPTRDKNVEDLSASELVLRYYAFMQQVNPAEHAALREGLERALEREPNHAVAWACLCNLYLLEYFDRFNPREKPLERAREAAWRSVKIDPACQMGLAQLAQVQFFSRDFTAFRQTAERAMALNPRDGTTWAYLAIMIAFSGDWERGTVLAQRTMELNSHHPGWYHLTVFHHHYRKGEYKAALQVAKKINMPEFHWAQLLTAAACGMLGRPEEARGAIELLRKYNPTFLDLDNVREDIEKWDPERGEVDRLLQGLQKAGLKFGPAGSAVAGTESKLKPDSGQLRAAAQEKSIAVLPFANLSADSGQDYFSDGLAEEIINLLAQVPGLKVIARTSAFAFRGKEQDIRGIAEALGVRTVLEGGVRRSGSRVRVTTQLINADDGSHLWSERFDRELSDIFAVQDEISEAIAGALRLRLSPDAVSGRYTPKLDAYEAFLKARHLHAQITPESMELARRGYEQANRLDPAFGMAHIGLGLYWLIQAHFGRHPARECMLRAGAEARRALQIDPSLPEAHALLGLLAATLDLDWAAAEKHFDFPMAKQANFEFIRPMYGGFQFLRGQVEQAIKLAQRAIEEDPLEVWPRMNLHAYLQAAGRDAEALEQLKKVLELDQNQVVALVSMAMLLADRGDLAEAIKTARRALAVGPWLPETVGVLAALLRRNGEEAESNSLARELGSGQAPGDARAHAVFHLLCGDIEQGAGWAEKAVEQRDASMMYYFRFVVSKGLRASPRWPKIARMINLPEGKL